MGIAIVRASNNATRVAGSSKLMNHLPPAKVTQVMDLVSIPQQSGFAPESDRCRSRGNYEYF